MIRNLIAFAIALAFVAGTSTAFADSTHTVTISTLKIHGETARFIVDATTDMTCTLSNGTSPTQPLNAEIVDGHGVGTTAELRKETITLLTAAFLSGKQVKLHLRRSDTGGTHCRIIWAEVL